MKTLFCLLLPLCLCGCSFIPHETVALEQSRIITALGIDISENGYRLVCYEGADLSEESKPDPNRLFEVEGATLSGALRNLRATSHRRPVLDYAGVILLGEELAKSKTESVLKELYDNPDFPYGTPLVLASPSASTVLKGLAKKTADLSGSIDSMLQSANQLSLPEAPDLPDFYNAFLSPTKDPYLPCLAEKDGAVSLDGVGIFTGKTLSSILTGDTAKGLGVLLGSARDYPLTVSNDITVYLRRIKITSPKNELCLKLYGDTDSALWVESLADTTAQKVRRWVSSTTEALQKANAHVLNVPLPRTIKVTCRIKELIS